MNNVRNRHMKSMRESSRRRTQFDSIKRDITERQERVVELQRSIEDEESVAKRKNKINSLQEQMKRTQKKVANDITFYRENDECGTCKQTIPLAYKADVIKERSDKLQEIEEAYGELEKNLT